MNDQYLVYAIIAIAAVYLLRHAYRKLRNFQNGECNGCGNNCGKPNTPRPEGVRQAPQATPLVTLSVGSRPQRPKPNGGNSTR